MKRIVALIITLILSCSAVSALAAGNIQATEDTASYVLSHSDGYRVYYYAVVTNNGDKRACINDLLFEIRDRDDVTFESTSKYSLYPEILEPGQSGWLVITRDVKDVDDKGLIDHFNLTITSKTADDDEEVRALTPFRGAAEELAAYDDWAPLYDLDRLAVNEVPVFAAVYFDDMYVDADLQLDTAARVGNVRTWVTNEYEHNGLRADGARVLGRLMDMGAGRV
jgi:hypothetical protein